MGLSRYIPSYLTTLYHEFLANCYNGILKRKAKGHAEAALDEIEKHPSRLPLPRRVSRLYKIAETKFPE